VLLKKTSREIAYECSEIFLTIPHLQYIDVNPEILKIAHSIMNQYSLKPRDAIHVACMSSQGIESIITEDKHFFQVPSIKRIWMNDSSDFSLQ